MRLLLLLGWFLASISHGFGMAAALSENAARNESDVIAHVEIVATTPPSSVENSPAATDHKTDSFSQRATARVIHAVKGCKEGDLLTLAFNNGFGCPNILYTEKEECLVFLKRHTDKTLHTMNLYCGRFNVTEGRVEHFYLMQPPGAPAQPVSLKAALAWLQKAPASVVPPAAK